jgi:hypothetical protein
MPGPLLHLGATVTCSHGGQATPTAPFPRVLLGGQPVVTLSSPYVVAGCALPPPTAGNGPCVTGQFTSGAVRILAGGQPVLLLGSPSVCAPTGTPLLTLAAQTRVIGS